MRQFILLVAVVGVVLVQMGGCPEPSPEVEQVQTPTFAPNGGTFADATDVTIACGTEGASIRYTTDGSDPTDGSTLYTDSFTLVATTTVKARAYKDGMEPSEVATVRLDRTEEWATPVVTIATESHVEPTVCSHHRRGSRALMTCP